jgi:tetratricopeptide (TPR) repeat protein
MNSTQFIEKGMQQLNDLQFSQAAETFTNALMQDPRSVKARTGLARIDFVKGEYKDADRLISEVLEIEPSNAEGLALKGVSSMQKESWEEAIAYLEKAIKVDPKMEMTYVNLSKSQRNLGNFKAAEEAARIAIKLNPENYQAHSQLAAVLFKMNRTKEGLKEMITSVRINPLYLRGYLVIGRILQSSGKIDASIRIYKRGLKFNPLAMPLRAELAAAYAFKGDYASAYKEAVNVALTRGNDNDWLCVGIFAIVLHKFEKAEKAFKKTLALNSQNAKAHYNLGELYFTAKLHQKAAEQYLLAIQKDAQDFKPFNGLGMLLLMVERNFEEAKKCFIKSLQLSPGQKEPMLNLALAYAANKEPEMAQKFAGAVLQVAKPGDGIFEQAKRLIAL